MVNLVRGTLLGGHRSKYKNGKDAQFPNLSVVLPRTYYRWTDFLLCKIDLALKVGRLYIRRFFIYERLSSIAIPSPLIWT